MKNFYKFIGTVYILKFSLNLKLKSIDPKVHFDQVVTDFFKQYDEGHIFKLKPNSLLVLYNTNDYSIFYVFYFGAGSKSDVHLSQAAFEELMKQMFPSYDIKNYTSNSSRASGIRKVQFPRFKYALQQRGIDIDGWESLPEGLLSKNFFLILRGSHQVTNNNQTLEEESIDEEESIEVQFRNFLSNQIDLVQKVLTLEEKLDSIKEDLNLIKLNNSFQPKDDSNLSDLQSINLNKFKTSSDLFLDEKNFQKMAKPTAKQIKEIYDSEKDFFISNVKSMMPQKIAFRAFRQKARNQNHFFSTYKTASDKRSTSHEPFHDLMAQLNNLET